MFSVRQNSSVALAGERVRISNPNATLNGYCRGAGVGPIN